MAKKIPFKELLAKIHGSLKTKTYHPSEKPQRIHQRTVFGDIVYMGSKPEKTGKNIQKEIERLKKVITKKECIEVDEINSGFCLDFADALQDRVGGTVVGKDDGTHYWLWWKGRYYDSDNPAGVKHLENLKFWQYDRGSWDKETGKIWTGHKRTRPYKSLNKKKI